MRGFFEIGIIGGKTPANLGTLWRSAYQLGAAGIFTIGKRYPQQGSDTVKAWRHIPLREYPTFTDFLIGRPFSAPLIGIEMGGKPLATFHHPVSCCYLLGAEDHGLPSAVRQRCTTVVTLETLRTESYNVAVAGSLVMYHRLLRQQGEHTQSPPGLRWCDAIVV